MTINVCSGFSPAGQTMKNITIYVEDNIFVGWPAGHGCWVDSTLE
jgi:hypothetical protein